MLLLAAVVSLVCVTGARALPDGRSYEIISRAEKNGLAPYAAVPSATGNVIDYQARGAFAGATWGSLNDYQAIRTSGGWQTRPLTPTPATPLGPLEEQIPVWSSTDLASTIFVTPQSYSPDDQDHGSLSLYEQNATGLEWVSQGTQGQAEPAQSTFDTATPDGTQVVFSSAASIVPAASGLDFSTAPEPQYLYERNITEGQTHLLSLDSAGYPAGHAETTLTKAYPALNGFLAVASVEGFVPGESITVGTGPAAETTRLLKILVLEGVAVLAINSEGSGLPGSFPAGTRVVQSGLGAVAGDGGNLASGMPPQSEVLPANAGSGSTTNAISSDGSKVFFEAPNPETGNAVGLYMRESNAATVKIAGEALFATTVTGSFAEESALVGSARFEGAAADGSLVFFTSEEGLAGATTGRELYAFNTTGHVIGDLPSMSVGPVSMGGGGAQVPATVLIAPVSPGEERIEVLNTAGFHAGEEILFGPFEALPEKENSNERFLIASVDSGTELTLTDSPHGAGAGIPAGDTVHAVHPAYMVAGANDGSHVFFESDGVLAANGNSTGATAVAAQPNLYVFDMGSGETSFIGTLTASDVSKNGNPAALVGEPDISRPAVPSPDGSVLVFASAANLTGQNPWQEYAEIYRYTAAGNTLTCLSCTAPGVKPTGSASFGETAGGTYDPPGLTSPMSEDGNRVFFQTPDSLVPEDTNGNAPLSPKFGTPTSTDVYEWEAGKVSLISSGSASTPTVLQGTTPSGDDVLFTTTAQLVPNGGDGGYENLFDARVGGGFPEPAQAAPSCTGRGCSATFGVAPAAEAPASTASHAAGSASGVLSAKAKGKKKPVACGKRQVKRRVKGRVGCARKARKAVRRGIGTHGSR